MDLFDDIGAAMPGAEHIERVQIHLIFQCVVGHDLGDAVRRADVDPVDLIPAQRSRGRR